MVKFDNDEIIYLEFPERSKMFYPLNVVLLLLRTICGLKQAVKTYWIATLEAIC